MDKELWIQLKYEDLYAFHMRNILTGGTGKFCYTLALIGIAIGGYNLIRQNTTSGIVFIAAGIFLMLSVPLMLRNFAKKNLTANPLLEQPLHYRFTDEGLAMVFDELPEDQRPEGVFPWSQAMKIRVMDEMIVVYTDVQHAHIFPFRELGEYKDPILEAIRIRVPANRIQGKV